MKNENIILTTQDYLEIKKHRIRSGLSQKEVAEKLNVTQSGLSYIEKGKNKEIGLSKAILLAKILNVSFDELFPSIDYKAKQDYQSLKEKADALESDYNSLKEKVPILEVENEALKEKVNFLQHLLDSDRFQRDKLKTYTYLENLISLFEICDMDYIYKVNPEIKEEKNVNYFAVLRFFKKYGAKSHLEVVKYLDIEKFKKTFIPNLVSLNNENNELMTENEIIEWVSNERKKLLKMNPE